MVQRQISGPTMFAVNLDCSYSDFCYHFVDGTIGPEYRNIICQSVPELNFHFVSTYM